MDDIFSRVDTEIRYMKDKINTLNKYMKILIALEIKKIEINSDITRSQIIKDVEEISNKIKIKRDK